MLAAQVRLWSNDVAGGYGRLKVLAATAPENAGVQAALVSALRARGWPRAAEMQAARAASLDRDSVPTRIMLGEAAFSRNRFAAARRAADELTTLAPDDPRVRRFARDVAAAMGWLLEAEAGPRWNDGGGANASDEEWLSRIRLETPRLAGGLGLFALNDIAIAHPPEGRAARYRVAGGITLRGADVAATVYGTTSWGSLSRGGAGFTLDWQPTDRLAFGLAGETFSSETPLRAILHGITANSLSGRVTWRWDERTSASASGSWLSFSDGNDHLSASLTGQHLLWTGSHADLTGRAGLWYDHNSQPGGPYFAPSQDLSGGAGLTFQQILWRRYENVFSHAFMADFGFQDQKGFATDWTGSFRYEQRWRHDPWWEIYWSAQVYRRVYDGDPEHGFGLTLGFRRRL